MKMKKLTVTGLLAAACMGLAAYAQTAGAAYPERPVKIVVPYAPGGGSDVIGRIVANKLSPRLGASVIVENKPGANSNLGAGHVAKAAADGYTLLLASNFITVNKSLMKQLDYDAAQDFVQISRFATAPGILVAGAQLPVGSLPQLIEYGRSNPSALSYASSGYGSFQQLNAAIIADSGKFNALHVPYKGSSPALADVLTGRVSFLVSPPADLIGHIQSGKLKALAVTGPDRLSMLPGTPTLKEAGLNEEGVLAWWGLLAPQGTPKDVVVRLDQEVAAVLRDPEVIKSVEALSLQVSHQGPERFKEFYAGQIATFAELIKKFDIPTQ